MSFRCVGIPTLNVPSSNARIERFAICCINISLITYRCIDDLPKFVRYYNDTVHSATGMAPSRVTDSDGLALRKKMGARRRSVRVVKVKFRVRQHLRISKETNNFEKAAEQNFSTEIFRIAKMIEGRPRPL